MPSSTKTATGNNQTLLVTNPSFTTYSSGGFSGVGVDFSDPSIASLTVNLADPSSANGTASFDLGASTGLVVTLVGITAVRGSTDDDLITYTASAPRTGTAYTVYVSEGSDSYSLYGNSTLSYAGYALGLTANLKTGAVTGKTGGNTDTLALVTPNALVMTGNDDTVLLDPTKTVTVDGGAGTDTLSWANFSTFGVTVVLSNGLDDSGNSFSNFEKYKGSSNDDGLFVGTATGYTWLGSEGNDAYTLNQTGTLDFSGYTVTGGSTGLTFNAKVGTVSGKNAGAVDVLALAVGATSWGALVGTSQNDTFIVSTNANRGVASINGGAGTDLLSFANVASATVNLDAHTATGISGTYTSIEQFRGSSGDDSFTAVTATGFTIFASAGADTYSLNGHGTLSYADFSSPLAINLSVGSVTGKTGADVITGTAPSIIGGSGNDAFTAKSSGNETLDGGGGIDTLYLSGTKASYFITDNGDGSGIISKIGQNINYSHFEKVVFSDSSQTLFTAPQDDFFGVGHSATFWRSASGDVWIWNNNGTAVDAYTHTAGQVDPVWKVAGIGDLDGDGKADAIFHNQTSGEIYFWTMNGGSIATQGDVTFTGGVVAYLDPTVWTALGARDFDGDGHADLLWQANTGLVYEWSLNGGVVISQGAVGNAPSPGGGAGTYSVLGFGDVNGDGNSDVVWYDQVDSKVQYWFMNGAAKTSATISMPSNLTVKGVGDFNRDGVADLVTQMADGTVVIATLNKNAAGVGNGGVASLDAVATVDPAVWSIKQVNDYNGDGYADILFTSTTGDVWVWEMNGTTIIGQGSAGHLDVSQNWTLYS